MAVNNDEQNNPNGEKARGYKVEDDNNLDEKALRARNLIWGGEVADAETPGHESHGMGGHAFGEMNETESGDSPGNPSRNAGYKNEYFRRTEPAEEHPENQNFKPEHQEGAPDEAMGKDEQAIHEKTINLQHEGGAEGNPDKIQEGTASYHDGKDH
ncbi:hypothetical protein [Mucilaginibacter terrae]|uniref:General stress protein n=1 Tax=Mucilaginibacter terrae TaxID=1955052 RepID=A0ABU3GP79_9SPHI|nr:hypothetical protein [Mucilaginibacter terrae]MDT3401581.1 hypothetical protein [Mucilaginibacter terrae]